nr:hypothetical protein [Brucella pituitosa]
MHRATLYRALDTVTAEEA